jgi:hypothetical protein
VIATPQIASGNPVKNNGFRNAFSIATTPLRTNLIKPQSLPVNGGQGIRMSEKTVKAIMEQAQVFASSWSMVDGPFAAEDQLERAEEEKAALQEMVTGALEGSVNAP